MTSSIIDFAIRPGGKFRGEWQGWKVLVILNQIQQSHIFDFESREVAETFMNQYAIKMQGNGSVIDDTVTKLRLYT